MDALTSKNDLAQKDSLQKEIISKHFPKQAERDRIKSLTASKSAGEIKAQKAFHVLFSDI